MRLSRALLLSVAIVSLLDFGFVIAQVSPVVPQGSAIEPWSAQWITCPNAPERDGFVFHFRKVLELAQTPKHFFVQVSADNQFVLHVNQQRVGAGPARGDLAHWRFETYDLAPFLHAGRNTLAATVWGFGTRSAYAQVSDRAGFMLHGNSLPERSADTNETWQVEEDIGLTAPMPSPETADYNGAEPGERIDAQAFDWLWDADPESSASGATDRANKVQNGFQTKWKRALTIDSAVLRAGQMQSTNWQLVPDPLPPMAMEIVSAGKVVRSSVLGTQRVEIPFSVPAYTTVSVLLDVSHLTTGYPELTVSGGRGATILQTYAEALIDGKGQKGNRNEIGGKNILGLTDEFLPDGSESRTFMPLAWRAWRYLQLDISTADQPLQVDRMRTWFTAYPFEERGHFHSDDAELASIWEIGWRTARLDAHDTYMDTPYWERLQYVGDTRIQALLSYVIAGDDRLARQAIEAFNDSRIPDGITQSRYPSNSTQFIPTFSLLWIGMIHDFWLYRGDGGFVRSQMPGTRTVLDWFLGYQRSDGLLARLPWWPFVDWAKDFEAGVPPQDADGGSAVITLQFIEALRYATELETLFGGDERAAKYRLAATRAELAIRKLCWSQKYGLIADTPTQTHFSQHANVLAVWLDVIPQQEQKTLLTTLLADELGGARVERAAIPPMSKATYYFRFYLARALDHAGMGDEYLRLLQPWRDMAALGLTTWAETPEPTRSDSHAWSAHPNFDLLTIVAGIRPKSSGFELVTIEPHLGTLQHLMATVPSVRGEIAVEYTRDKSGLKAKITLPHEVSGDFIWNGKLYKLHSGDQELVTSK
jgi:alpha-L-rhamnosidase